MNDDDYEPSDDELIASVKPRPALGMATFSGERIGISPDTLRRTMHTEEHGLAKEISEYCKEPRLFARYLGRILKVGKHPAYQAFSELKDVQRRTGVKHPGRWWMWRTKHLTTPKELSTGTIGKDAVV